jgi:hypothetical protein
VAVIYLIAHAAWAPGRSRSLVRLLEQLPNGRVRVFESDRPEHACQWAQRIWQRAAEYDGPVCILNDDVRITSAEDIEACAAAAPDECLSLCCTNPAAAIYVPWVRSYHYSGPGVVLAPGAARSLLAYVATLPWNYTSRANEDNVANAWAWDRQRPFLYPLPSPVDHDPSIPSTLGYDDHPNRTACRFGKGPREVPVDPPFVELSWNSSAYLHHQRTVFRAGHKLCTICTRREGKVGNKVDMVCIECLASLTTLALRNTK